MAAYGTRLWLPLPLQALLDQGLGMRLRRAIQAGEWDPSHLTLAVAPGEAGSNLQTLATALAELALCEADIAFTDVSLLSPKTWLDSIRSGCIDEIRFNGHCMRRAAADSLAATVASVHAIGITASGLDVTTLEQCEIAIQNGLDSVQGSLIGRAYSVSQLEAQLIEESTDNTRPGLAMGTLSGQSVL
jgi:EAL domain-containing protein (putative c-di-GMP-specific phosphodiesterase class I)